MPDLATLLILALAVPPALAAVLTLRDRWSRRERS